MTRHQGTLAIVIGLVVAVGVVLWTGADDRRSGYLDPDNPDPDGGRAVARVLADQGVDLTVARDADELANADPGADTTVVVTSTDRLGTSTADRLVDDSEGARLVLVDPEPGLADALGLAQPMRVAPDGAVAAGCTDPTYDGLSVAVDQALAYPDPEGCFPVEAGVLVTEPRAGLVLLGAGEALTNDQVLRADNAAVALRLLGGSDRLVWYVPSLEDLGPGDGVSLTTLLPDWLRPTLLLGAVAALVLVLWRARRLGALAVEPLPVSVRAIETTRSRGRLYRKAGDRAHAAEVLRTAARARATERLRLGSRTDAAALVHDLARHTGRPAAEIDALIGPHAPTPSTDHALITLADDLAELDREVRRP